VVNSSRLQIKQFIFINLPNCGAMSALAHHHGTFRLTDEAIDAPEKALEAARKAAGIGEDRFRVLKPGEAWELT